MNLMALMSLFLGGGIAVPTDHPIAHSVVSLGFCSGTLISDHSLVTAAHCLDQKNPNDIVVLGRHGTSIKIPPVFQRYDSELPNKKNAFDIGVLFFEGGLPEGYTPALMNNEEIPSNGISLTLTGFGEPHHGTLMMCDAPVINKDFSVSEFQMQLSKDCFLGGGDSGGADLVVKGDNVYLLGLHTWGWHDADGNPSYSVESKISFYLNWIRSLSP